MRLCWYHTKNIEKNSNRFWVNIIIFFVDVETCWFSTFRSQSFWQLSVSLDKLIMAIKLREIEKFDSFKRHTHRERKKQKGDFFRQKKHHQKTLWQLRCLVAFREQRKTLEFKWLTNAFDWSDLWQLYKRFPVMFDVSNHLATYKN